MASSHTRRGRDRQPHPTRWPKRHLKTRWGGGSKNKDVISAGAEGYPPSTRAGGAVSRAGAPRRL